MAIPCAGLATVLLAGLFGGCALINLDLRHYEHKFQLSESDYASYLGRGTAGIAGVVSVKMKDGKISHGDQPFIYLIPATPYTAEWFEHYILNDHDIRGIDPRSLPATRSTVVGIDGRFEFSRLPAGDYYMSCSFRPEAPPYHFLWVTVANPSVASIKAYAAVTLAADDKVQVTVTRPSP